MKILIADDDPVARMFLCSALQALNHEVIACSDGVEAWKSYCAEPTRVVISDWRMPGPDGLELCKLIRTNASEPTFFMLCSSACTSDEHQIDARNAGVDHVLQKPVDATLLGRLLERAGHCLGFSSHEPRG